MSAKIANTTGSDTKNLIASRMIDELDKMAVFDRREEATDDDDSDVEPDVESDFEPDADTDAEPDEDITYRAPASKTVVYQGIMSLVNEYADAGDLHWEGSTGVYLRLRRERFVGAARAALLIEGLVLRDLDCIVSNPAALPGIIDALSPTKGELQVSKRVGYSWEPVDPDEADVPGFPEAARILAARGVAGHLRISDDLCFVKMDVGDVQFDMRLLAGYVAPKSVVMAYARSSLCMKTIKRCDREYIDAAWACKRVLVYDTVMNTKIRPTRLTCSEALAIAFVEPVVEPVVDAVDLKAIVHSYALHSQIAMNAYLRCEHNLSIRDDPIVNAFIEFFSGLIAE